ncbi:MAG: hypothetical protein JXA46_18520 [Dehalococcoidales bacterium]|nr:hypothetical protein [Dehalococcoidales bacterium]
MGTRLTQYFNEANKLGGLKAKMRLAVLTKMSGQTAETEADSPENINKFEKAIQEVRKEF